MDQLYGPNYREKEVGALEEDVNREDGGRKNQDGGMEVKGTNVTGGSGGGGEWQRRSSVHYKGEQSAEMNETNCSDEGGPSLPKEPQQTGTPC